MDSSEGLVDEPQSPAARRRSSVTTRALALAVVFLVLTISFASSLRVYVAQTKQIATTRQQISDSQRRIADLNTQLAEWNDPAYVRTQARARLGWVLPGEVGYRVVDEDAQQAANAPAVGAESQSVQPQDAWWQKLWGSVEAADKPAPAPSAPTKVPTITPSTKPQPSATASSTPR